MLFGMISFIWIFISGGFLFGLSRMVTAALTPNMVCPGCRELIPCVNKWRVGSYVDHVDRHVLLARDRINGSYIGQINCPVCEVTILI
jgi:hypothetical protein